MNLKELSRYLQSLPDKILPEAADIVAETATEYYKDAFRVKGFDGNPWAPAKHPKRTGSLLIDSGNLLNSIRPAVVTPGRVVISAGNSKVPYAAVHNEGYHGTVCVPAHTRRVKKTGKTHDVAAHTRIANFVERRFMGDSSELNQRIHDRIEGFLSSLDNL